MTICMICKRLYDTVVTEQLCLSTLGIIKKKNRVQREGGVALMWGLLVKVDHEFESCC